MEYSETVTDTDGLRMRRISCLGIRLLTLCGGDMFPCGWMEGSKTLPGRVGVKYMYMGWKGGYRGQNLQLTKRLLLLIYVSHSFIVESLLTNKHNAEIRAGASPRNAFLMIRKWKAVAHSVFPLEKEMNPGVFGFTSLSFVIC